MVTGDLLSHIPVLDQAHEYGGGAAYDFTPMFAAVRPTLEAADVSICHLETPLVPTGTEPDPLPPDYGIPAELAAGIKVAGFDRCSLASNHAMDKGAAGVDTTLGALDGVGVGHTGMARTPEEAAPSVFTSNGVTIAHLSATYGYNIGPPNGESWRSNLIDTGRIVAEAQQARAGGAEFVIASLHWGAEGSTDVTFDQRRVADEIMASGAVDLIVGHHAHVVQPIEQINGRWVVFGLGNFLSAMNASTKCCGIRGQDGMMVRIEVTEQADGSFVASQPQAIATYIDRDSYVILPVQAGITDPARAGTVGPGALQESLNRTASVVGPYLVPA